MDQRLDLSFPAEQITSSMVVETVGGTELSPTPEPELFQVQVRPVVSAAVIVAHPDDETLWAGGLILTHPDHNWFIVSTCRKSDFDRSRKFFQVLSNYGALGALADLDDGPDQTPLAMQDVQRAILQLLPPGPYDVLLSHAPGGEYTRHRRHEEVSRAVMDLWESGTLPAGELRLFAYGDGGGSHLPQANQSAHQFQILPETIWNEKYRLITEVYGFEPESWEARTAPRSEAFWCFESPAALQAWRDQSRLAG